MKKSMQGIILAAGKSTRMQNDRTKLVEKICGQEMILYATKLLRQMQLPTTIVIGYNKQKVVKTITNHHSEPITFIEQKEQLGTGNALAVTSETWNTNHILVLNGDVPLITSNIIENLYETHINQKSAITFVTSYLETPGNRYGKVITTNNKITIVEAKDLNDPIHKYPWINAGIYLIERKFLQENISFLTTNNAQNEFYITDLVNIANEQNKKIATTKAPFDYVRGINTFEELNDVEQIKRDELINHWMDLGVRFDDLQSTHIDLQTIIGEGSYIGCGVHLIGNTTIGAYCHIHEFCSIESSTIGDNSIVYSHSIIKNTIINKRSKIGPFANIKENKKNKFTTISHTQKTPKKDTKKLFAGARVLQEDFTFYEEQ